MVLGQRLRRTQQLNSLFTFQQVPYPDKEDAVHSTEIEDRPSSLFRHSPPPKTFRPSVILYSIESLPTKKALGIIKIIIKNLPSKGQPNSNLQL